MKKLIFLVLSLFIAEASAESQAIKATNYYLNLDYLAYSDSGYETGINGGARIPIAKYIGIKVAAGISQFKYEPSNDIIDSYSSKKIGLGILLRKNKLGMVEAEYTTTKYDIPNVSSELSFNEFLLNGILYINRFDVIFTRGQQNFKNASSAIEDKTNYNVFGASYYVNDYFNIKVQIAKADKTETDQRNIVFTYVPKSIKNISFAFSNTNTTGTNKININAFQFSYYFDTKVSLIERARYY